MKTLRLATRGSLLARTQSQQVADALTAATGVAVELVIVQTRGDQITDRPLAAVGGKGLFTKEIEVALQEDRADLAVHSMKDMPTDDVEGLTIAAIPERVDPRDVLIGSRLSELAAGSRVGTGSARRAMQIAELRPDLEIVGIRGNVDTRIAKQQRGEYDVIVLAMAGLARLGRGGDVTEILDVDRMVPAVGQGALAIQCRRNDRVTQDLLEHIHHPPSAVRAACERSFLTAISGGCSAPAAAHSWLDGDHLVAVGVWSDDQGPMRRVELRSDPMHGVALGRELAQRVRT